MSLLFNASQLLKSEVGTARRYEFKADEPLDLGDFIANDVRGQVKFTLTNFGVVANILVEAELNLNCARCLEDFMAPAVADFVEEYRPSIDMATGLPSNLPAGDETFEISANHMIDLSEAIRQQVLLTVDLIPVCDRDCPGLCPSCGANLKQGPCNCPPADSTNPFVVLQSLLTDAPKDA